MVEPAPAPALVVPKPEFLLEFLVVALDPPAQLGQVDEALEGDVRGQGREPVCRGLLLLRRPLDQQPFLRAGLAKMLELHPIRLGHMHHNLLRRGSFGTPGV